jgi:hypothetical protein
LSKIDEYLANPEGKLAFVLASKDPEAKVPEFILIAYGADIIAKMTLEEAYSVADFFYERLPPRNKGGIN